MYEAIEINWYWKDQICAVKLNGSPPNKKDLTHSEENNITETREIFKNLKSEAILLVK